MMILRARHIKKTIALLVIIFGLIFGYDAFRGYMIKRYFATLQQPPLAVSTTLAKNETWHPHIKTIGSLVAINGVNVTSEVAGAITKIMFNSGEIVKQNDPLVQLDDSIDVEEYQNNLANLKLAQINFERAQKLITKNVISRSDFDTALTQLQSAKAVTNKNQILINKKLIKAPFAGKIGIRTANIGQYVSPGDQLVSLQSLDPMYINFSLPEQYFKSLHVNEPVLLKIDAYPKQEFQGEITAINSEVNINTRNILVQATVKNDKSLLYPGMYANVEVILPEQHNVVTVPQTAIDYNLYGNSVYIVQEAGKDKDGKPLLKVFRKYVHTGETNDNDVAIKGEVKAGDQVVTSGQLKLQDGSPVTINNTVELKNLDKHAQIY